MLFCFGDGGQRIAHNSVHSSPSDLAPLSSCSASQDASNGLSVASGPNFFNGTGVNSKFTDCVDHGEAVAAAVLLGGGRVVAKVIIINMNKTNGDASENPQGSTEAATCTKEALEERGPAEEQTQKPLQPGADQDSCLASSLSYTIDELNWSGTDDDVAMDLINQVRQLQVPLRKIGRSREGEEEALEIVDFTVQGKTVRVRNDHDETAAGPTEPMISSRCLDDDEEVNDI